MKNFGDFVHYYDILDVIGMVEGIARMSKIYLTHSFESLRLVNMSLTY